MTSKSKSVYVAQFADCVEHPTIFSKEYDPHFRPLIGKLEASFNGCIIRIYANADHVVVEATGLEFDHKFGIKFDHELQHSWQEILQLSIKEILYFFTTQAIQQLDMYRACNYGGFHVH